MNFFIQSKAVVGNLSGAAPTVLTAPGGGGAAAFGISSTGEVAGASVMQNGVEAMPLLWKNGTPQTLPLLTGYAQGLATSVNDSGVAAGTAFNLDFMVLIDNSATAHGGPL